MAHPYATLVDGELTRAEADVGAFRTRALTVVTTSSGIVTLLTGLVTFAASNEEEDVGLPAASVVCVAIALSAFVAATVFALLANKTRSTEIPVLSDLATKERWHDGDTESEHQRVATKALITYTESLQAAAKTISALLDWAVRLQIVGLAFASASAVVTMAAI